jgi:hypothetical protein
MRIVIAPIRRIPQEISIIICHASIKLFLAIWLSILAKVAGNCPDLAIPIAIPIELPACWVNPIGTPEVPIVECKKWEM